MSRRGGIASLVGLLLLVVALVALMSALYTLDERLVYTVFAQSGYSFWWQGAPCLPA